MFNHIIHPITNDKLSLFSIDGKSLLKHYVRLIQTGGSRPESCQKCHQFYNRMVEYRTRPSSATTLQTYNFCINCAENLLQERENTNRENPTYTQITQDAEAAIANGEKAREHAKSGGIDLTKIRQTGMEIRKNLGSSTVRSSVPRSVPRSTVRSTKHMCQQAMKIGNDVLNKLRDTEYFSISFDDIYTLIMSTNTRDKTIYINPYYRQEYYTLLDELDEYIKNLKNLKKQCSSPNRSRLIDILKFFIETSDTGGGSDLPVAPQTQLPKISATPQPQKQKVAVAIPSGL